jgi:hypothetical protein
MTANVSEGTAVADFSVLYVCPEGDIPRTVRSSHGESGYPEVEWRWVSGFHVAPLYAHLAGIPVAQANRELASILVEEDGALPYDQLDPNDPDQWVTGYLVTRFPDRLVEALARLGGSDRTAAGHHWQSELTAMKDPMAPHAVGMLDTLCDLAGKGVASGHCLILAESGG